LAEKTDRSSQTITRRLGEDRQKRTLSMKLESLGVSYSTEELDDLSRIRRFENTSKIFIWGEFLPKNLNPNGLKCLEELN
jgi:hypothetical protein